MDTNIIDLIRNNTYFDYDVYMSDIIDFSIHIPINMLHNIVWLWLCH